MLQDVPKRFPLGQLEAALRVHDGQAHQKFSESPVSDAQGAASQARRRADQATTAQGNVAVILDDGLE